MERIFRFGFGFDDIYLGALFDVQVFQRTLDLFYLDLKSRSNTFMEPASTRPWIRMFEILLQSILIWNSYNILNIETMNRVKRCFRIIDMMLMRIPHCCFLSIHKCYYQKTVLVSNLYTHVITYVLFELSWLSIKILRYKRQHCFATTVYWCLRVICYLVTCLVICQLHHYDLE